PGHELLAAMIGAISRARAAPTRRGVDIRAKVVGPAPLGGPRDERGRIGRQNAHCMVAHALPKLVVTEALRPDVVMSRAPERRLVVERIDARAVGGAKSSGQVGDPAAGPRRIDGDAGGGRRWWREPLAARLAVAAAAVVRVEHVLVRQERSWAAARKWMGVGGRGGGPPGDGREREEGGRARPGGRPGGQSEHTRAPAG